jgi:hypothetical protein
MNSFKASIFSFNAAGSTCAMKYISIKMLFKCSMKVV